MQRLIDLSGPLSPGLEAHCRAIWFADLVCSGVPHYAPDQSRTFEQMLSSRSAGFSDDLVMTLAKVRIVQQYGSPSVRSIVPIRRAIVDWVRPFVDRDPAQWGPRFSGLVQQKVSVEADERWTSHGSGSVMSAGPLALSSLDDEGIGIITAATHLHVEAISATTAMVRGLRFASQGASSAEVVDAMMSAAREGERKATELVMSCVGAFGGRSRPIDLALALATQPNGELDDLIDDPSDFTSARYVLACGVRAFLRASEQSSGCARMAVEVGGRSGDPDTAAVVGMALLQAAQPATVSAEIDVLLEKHRDIGSFDRVLTEVLPWALTARRTDQSARSLTASK